MRERAVAEINFRQIGENIAGVRAQLGTASTIMAVVKAEAYGLGMRGIVEGLWQLGVREFAVATWEEGVALRSAFPEAIVLCLNEIGDESGVIKAVSARLEMTVFTQEYIALVGRIAAEKKCPVNVHLKVDTGLHRLGCDPEAVSRIRATIDGQTYLFLKGFFTHFARADDDPNFTAMQISKFREICRQFSGPFPLVHLSNTAGIQYPYAHGNYVRLGLGIYDRAVTLKSVVQFVREVAKGEPVGYSGLFRSSTQTNIAVVPIGYADGIPSSLGSGAGTVLIRGKRLPIVGQVCMDLLMVDLGRNSDISSGDEVVFLGRQGGEEITLQEVSVASGRLPREIFCGLGPRVKRKFLF